MLDLERELRELTVAWPETPDLATAVEGRLPERPARVRARWLVVRPAWQLAVAFVALAIAITMVVPPARSAVLEWLGLSSVRVVREEPSRFAIGLVAGDPVTLDQARERAGFDVLIPEALGEPDAAYLYDGEPQLSPRLDLVYRERPGLPRASTTGAGLLITETQATVEPLIEKTIGSAASFERLEVGGDPAYFISGPEHGFAYIDAVTGQTNFESERLAGPTLLVERADGILVRIEGEISRDRAVEIAESLR